MMKLSTVSFKTKRFSNEENLIDAFELSRVLIYLEFPITHSKNTLRVILVLVLFRAHSFANQIDHPIVL